MDAFRSLDRSAAVRSFEVVEYRTWHSGSYLRLHVLLRDGSELHTREYVDESERKYSFHWQTNGGTLRVRWDNAPHHPELATHPDHKHVGSEVEPTVDVTLDGILAFIEQSLSH
jgi:hypothetical protein